MNKVWDPRKGEYKEYKTDAEKSIRFLNTTSPGILLNNHIFRKKFFSSLMGKAADLGISRYFIKGFIAEHGINMEESFEKEGFSTFNDFFTRKLKPQSRRFLRYHKYQDEGLKTTEEDIAPDDILISPGDGALTVRYISSEESISVKGKTYLMKDLMNGEDYNILYTLRLSPQDYHRFHYPMNGYKGKTEDYAGYYQTVNPLGIKSRPETYWVNKKKYFTITSETLGTLLFMAVGATGVGGIVTFSDEGGNVNAGEEAGYFHFGGSTILLFASSEFISPGEEFLAMSEKGIETKVLMGDNIGIKKE